MSRLWIAGLIMMAGSVFSATNQTVIVSAPRLDNLDLMAVDTAADVTVINRETIEESGAVSVPDLLRNEANVLIRSTTGNPQDGQIAMRGFGDNSHLRTLVLVDGHKLNRGDMGGIGWPSVPVSNIDRIEVIRGGQNVLYGDRAVGGVVKITTKRGADSGTQFGGSIGSFGYLSGYAGYGGAVENVDYYIGVDSYDFDGFRSNSTSRASTLSGSLAWYIGDADTLTVRSSYTDSSMLYPGSLSYEEMKVDPTQSISGQGESEVEAGLNSLIWETDRDWGAARVTSGLSFRNMSWELDGLYGRNDQMGVSLGPRVRWGSETNFFMTGLDFNYDTLDFDDLHPDDTRYRRAWAELERFTVSPYVFSQKSLLDKFTVTGGARFEYAQTDNVYVDYNDDQVLPYVDLLGLGRFPNPDYKNPPDTTTNSYSGVITKEGWAVEFSVEYDFNKNWSGWTGYDRLYRYPVLDEVAAYQGYPLSDPLNEKLDPETGNEFEVGVRYRTKSWRASCAAYYMMMYNEIVFDDAANLNRNLGATRRGGAEVELAVDKQWYGASTRWTFQDARLHGGEYDGNMVPLVPWNYGVFSVWTDPVERLRLTLSYSYVSQQYQGNDEANTVPELDAYGLFGFIANITLTDYARLQVVIDNLLDESYAPLAYNGTAYYPGIGRSFRAGIALEF